MPCGAAARSAPSSLDGYSSTWRTRCPANSAGKVLVMASLFSMT